MEAAEIVAADLGLDVKLRADLGEIDRSATGYLPEPEFWANYREFLASPSTSARGWETADHTQRRIVRAFEAVLTEDTANEVAIMCHGGVAALYRCHLRGVPIQRLVDQPQTGSHYSFDAETGGLIQDWLSYEDFCLQAV
jgi:broad specificity phosphatase PhoE